MKIRNVLICLVAVAVFSVAAVAQDTCETAVPEVGKQIILDPCLDTVPTGPLGSCTGGDGVLDVWGSFVAQDTELRIRTDVKSVGTDSDFIVYSGDCDNLVEIGCSEDDCYGETHCNNSPPGLWLGNICVGGLTIGETYYIQMGTFGDYCPNGPYHVEIMTTEVCGDGALSCSGSEQCDGKDDVGCERGCESGDTCLCLGRLSAPMLPSWGLAGLGLLLLAGGAMVFGRRRASTA